MLGGDWFDEICSSPTILLLPRDKRAHQRPIWENMLPYQWQICDWAGVVVLEPLLDAFTLIGVPVVGHHGVDEHAV